MQLSSLVARLEPLLNKINSRKAQGADLSGMATNPHLQNPRKPPEQFPELSEVEVMRHYYRLAKLNYAWEDGLYPLGSCTMKYNPVINGVLAALPAFNELSPTLPAQYTQGALHIIHETEYMMATLLDMPYVTLQPAAGAHGELMGAMMIAAYFADKGETRSTILIPDSAHGTNPASATIAGFKVEKVPSTSQGLTDVIALEKLLSGDVAALMLTNPNTLGVFEENIIQIKQLLDQHGALLYMDGANLNAMVGRVSLGKMGVDLTQLNLHKTFSTPHGGGGPGQGALACSQRLAAYLPSPQISESIIDGNIVYDYYTPAKSIGRMKAFYGHFSNIVRAWAYLKTYGNQAGTIADVALLNANYLKQKLQVYLTPASQKPSMHEVVFSHKTLQERGLTTLSFAKALLDRGFYAPTIYFPLNVPGAIMVEPTETETREEMDAFVAAVADIFSHNKDQINTSPQRTFVKEIDEVAAARNPRLTWHIPST